MELAGDEKRIRALFSELSFEDCGQTPRFEELWRGAQVMSPVPRFNKPLVFVVVMMLVIVAAMVATWSRFTSTPRSVDHVHKLTPPQQIVTPAPPPASESQTLALVPRRQHSHPNRQRSLARVKQTGPTLQQQAAMLANWHSPTDTFMASPSASVFNSLPQLNQSAKDLESFLPKNSQSMKESNQ